MKAYRRLNAKIITALALGFSLFELYTVGFGILSPFAQRATMLIFASVLVFLTRPMLEWCERDEMAPSVRAFAMGWDALFIGLALYTCIYLVVEEEALADRSGAETTLDLVVAGLGPVMLLEMVRRAVGVPLFVVTLCVVVYSYLGDVTLIFFSCAILFLALKRFSGYKIAVGFAALALLFFLWPGRGFLDSVIYPFRGEEHSRLAAYLWLTSEGTFGTISAIMSEFIFIFILFSALLEATGTGQILIKLAFSLTGRFRGGPAQAAVVASSMFGMVSGSTMANVVSTGTFTIPLMIRTGFSRLFAGAVESVASCGGQIVPPIMGASVFIMSEIIEVPYVYLMLSGLIPAFLYYFSLSTSIYFEACRLGLERMDKSEVPDARAQLQQGGYLLVPVLILLASIVSGETPGLAGYKAVVSLIVMVDLVRSLRFIRARWGNTGVYLTSALILVSIFFAFGPVSAPGMVSQKINLPLWGDTQIHRLALVLIGVCFALVPGWRGLPFVLPVALGLARWKIPSELAWVGQIPHVGLLLPIALCCIVVYLIALPVFRAGETPEAKTSARELGDAVWRSLETGAKNSLGLVAATSAIGLIVGLLVLAAVGVRISILVTEMAATSLFLAFFLVMIASLVMGMGLPTIAAYLLLVIVVAPSVTSLGASLVAAHFFIFYFGVISSITPPVALAAYGASGISGANPMQTGFTACRLAVTAFIVPYLFVYYPELLLLKGNFWAVAYRLTVSCAGIALLSMATMGFGRVSMSAPMRTVMTGASLLLFLGPAWLHVLGLATGGAILFRQKSGERTPE